MTLVSFFSEDNVLSDEKKSNIFSNIKVTKIDRSAFWGTPGTVKSALYIINAYLIGVTRVNFIAGSTVCTV